MLLRAGAEVVSWPLVAARCDVSLVDDLARLQLTARRAGYVIRLRDASAQLRELVDLCGLTRALSCRAPLGREAFGEAEESEDARADEAVVPDDPVA